jgi:hypothetical protein
VLKPDIKADAEYALREKRGPGVPLQRVRVIVYVRRNKWKVEWIDPNPGVKGGGTRNNVEMMPFRVDRLALTGSSRLATIVLGALVSAEES